MLKYDLHSHTNASDGQLTPADLIDRAIEKGVDVLAITDHDSISGVIEGTHYMQILRQTPTANPLILVSGIEVSTQWQNKDIHIVGLNIDIDSPALLSLIQAQKAKRVARAELMGARLAKANIPDAYLGAKSFADNDANITRAHFAKWLVAQGYAKNMNEVFKKYLVRGKPGYVPPPWCDMMEAIDVIHQAGGRAVLAHPLHYKLTTKWLRRLIVAFKQAQGDAMEIAYPQQNIQQRRYLANFANEYALFTSQGSDFHYPTPWLDLGRNLYQLEDVVPVWYDWNIEENEGRDLNGVGFIYSS